MTQNNQKYAIIETGGKQYRVEEGGIVDVELLGAENGSQVQFDILFFSDGSSMKVGTPSVAGFTATGKVLGEVKGEKIESVKYKPNHTSRRRFGHRQHYSRVQIDFIGSSKEKRS
jgi:large subunit ribosomal protein L21